MFFQSVEEAFFALHPCDQGSIRIIATNNVRKRYTGIVRESLTSRESAIKFMQHFFEKIRLFFFYFDTYLFENKAGNKIYMVVCHIVFFLNTELAISKMKLKEH